MWGYVALTDRYVKFWNILARGLKQRFPDRDVCVGAYAYSAYSTPPVAEKLEKNITMAYVGCFPLESEANREKQKNDWKRWWRFAALRLCESFCLSNQYVGYMNASWGQKPREVTDRCSRAETVRFSHVSD